MPEIRKRKPLVRDASLTLHLRRRFGGAGGEHRRRGRGRAELWMLCGYGAVASYLFGLLTNLWFWPFAVGAGTGISYIPGAPLETNLASFVLYSLVTSTAGWDTVRAVTTIIGITLVGRAVLAAFRRVKPVSSAGSQTAKGSSTPDKRGPCVLNFFRGGPRPQPDRM